MWHPEPGWQRLPGGTGPSTYGVWLAVESGRELVVKRLQAPHARDPAELSDPHHPAYWRRPVDVALSGATVGTPGLRDPAPVRVEEDEDGATLVQERVAEAANPGLFVARCLGRFAAADLGEPPWLARRQLRARLRRVEHGGGWPTLARTTVADVADHLWSHREGFLRAVEGLPQVTQHGDPVPANLPGRSGDDVLAIDWSALGTGPVGADLGYYALSAREDFAPLLEAYVAALPSGLAGRDEAELGARVTAVFTVLTRAEWALARVAHGEGALAGKYRHPSVAPYLRALQRQIPQIEALLSTDLP
ncbi:MAG TPA: phosphotransferase [Nocardioides sp.]|uniref:phosphotransferase n=1 Tax=Nocardioides sp. TaxID=35761 RepID=UPI002C9F7D71|nr:phosphotransferase [Nocardioides sp.]HQR25667.1 phosphotransferase [Nocardioides sp.]